MAIRVFAITGFVAGVVLSVIDFITSYQGISGIIPADTQSLILRSAPLIFAVLAVTFNGASHYLIRHFGVERFGTFGNMIVFFWWLVFLAYDWITSFLGVAAEFAGEPLGTTAAIIGAVHELDAVRLVVVCLFAALASSGPFLAASFSDLLGSQLRSSAADADRREH